MAIEDWDLKLANRMIDATNRKGFMSVITKAERGYGKSMYNLKNMTYTYYTIGELTENQAWQKALDNFIFTPDQLMNRVEQNIADDVISPAWCIDDATVHFSSYLYFINLYQASLLNATFDTIRTVVNALLINCPKKKRLLTGLRNYDDHEITIYKTMPGGYQRKSVCIKWYSLPSGKQNFRKEFEDYFSCYVPTWIYKKYMEKRKSYLKDISKELKELKEKLDQRKLKIENKAIGYG